VVRIPVEIKGQQLRIRVKSPKKFSKFRILDVGKRGRLQAVLGKLKGYDKWDVQSWRLNLSTYDNYEDALDDLTKLLSKYEITEKQYVKANKIIIRWFDKKHVGI
jgi:hypothetical protein